MITFVGIESTSTYRSFRYHSGAELDAITDESQMPWNLPPNGASTDLLQVILANQSVGLSFVDLFFQKNVDSLYFLHYVSNDPTKSELTYRRLRHDANSSNSLEIENTNPFDRLDMVVALPDDLVYGITQTENGPVVRKLNVMSEAASLEEEVCLTLRSDS